MKRHPSAEEHQATEVEKRLKLDENLKNSTKQVAESPSIKALLLRASFEKELEDERQKRTKLEEELAESMIKCLAAETKLKNVQEQDTLKYKALKKKLKKYRNAKKIKAKEIIAPKWIISENDCQKMYEDTKKDIELFVKDFVRRLFKKDVILPESHLNRRKWKEAINVILWLWKVKEETYKKVFVYLLKSEMKKLRGETRQEIYNECSKKLSIGYTSGGKKIYFSWQPNNNRWEPFFDEEGRHPMEFAKTGNSRTCNLNVGIPLEYATSKHIIFVQKTTSYRIFKIHKNGDIHDVFERKLRNP